MPKKPLTVISLCEKIGLKLCIDYASMTLALSPHLAGAGVRSMAYCVYAVLPAPQFVAISDDSCNWSSMAFNWSFQVAALRRKVNYQLRRQSKVVAQVGRENCQKVLSCLLIAFLDEWHNRKGIGRLSPCIGRFLQQLPFRFLFSRCTFRAELLSRL